MSENRDFKPFLCRLGIHTRLWGDGAYFYSGERCGRCSIWIPPEDGARVEKERALWQEVSDKPFKEAMRYVYRHLGDPSLAAKAVALDD